MPCADKCFACATEQEIMVDLLTTSTSAFSHRHPSRHVNPAGWPSTVTVEGSQRPPGPITLSKAEAEVLFWGFCSLGDACGDLIFLAHRSNGQQTRVGARMGCAAAVYAVGLHRRVLALRLCQAVLLCLGPCLPYLCAQS